MHIVNAEQMREFAFSQIRCVFGATPFDAATAGLMEDISVILDPILRAVDLADRCRSVAVSSEMSEHIGQTIRVGATQAVVAMVMTILTRQPRDTTGRADRILGDRILKADALR